MKKMRIGVWIFLMTAVAFCLTACGNRNAANGTTGSSGYETTAPSTDMSTGSAYESSSAAGSIGTTGTDTTGGTSGAGTVNGTETTGTGGAMEESDGGIIRDIMDGAETMLDDTGNAIKNTVDPTTAR